LHTNKELLFNERDFQMHLATHLRTNSKFEDVDVEYFVPAEELENYPWINRSKKKAELRLDILVRKGEEFLPIELKYKTKKVERQISRFDELLDEKVIVMKNQGAQDLGMYDFWKDVRRIELVRNRFERVKGGLAVFVTNDVFYTKGSKHSSNNYLLGMAGDVTRLKQKHWRNPESTCAKTHPNFDIEQAYDIVWHSREIDNEYFYYCIVNI
jgi:hypothetical protein